MMRRRALRFALVAGLATALLVAPPLFADGGQVRVSQAPAGPFLVTVFTSPIPLRTGHVDVSVLLQDRNTKDPVHDATIAVTAEPVGHEGKGGTFPATRAQATNKLFQAAEFDIQGAGLWRFTVTARNDQGEGTVHFDVDVPAPGLLDRGVWLWILLAIPIALVLWFMTRGDERKAEVAESDE